MIFSLIRLILIIIPWDMALGLSAKVRIGWLGKLLSKLDRLPLTDLEKRITWHPANFLGLPIRATLICRLSIDLFCSLSISLPK
ncbi:hypothetical protein C8R26_1155 [Nitrosomonas oligotropha]|uniref:Uncharacterized protein n=1 Tax=Nitrosomonas oligotropha TaxID=42354 RepID=A0A2T5HYG4_9PROT|nr:hypothetical protein C8R26_1155 [Nitrosomonas oligotropha]